MGQGTCLYDRNESNRSSVKCFTKLHAMLCNSHCVCVCVCVCACVLMTCEQLRGVQSVGSRQFRSSTARVRSQDTQLGRAQDSSQRRPLPPSSARRGTDAESSVASRHRRPGTRCPHAGSLRVSTSPVHRVRAARHRPVRGAEEATLPRFSAGGGAQGRLRHRPLSGTTSTSAYHSLRPQAGERSAHCTASSSETFQQQYQCQGQPLMTMMQIIIIIIIIIITVCAAAEMAVRYAALCACRKVHT